jgi:hypothetical protein
MNHVIFYNSVDEQFELVSMRSHVIINIGCDLRLHDMYDMRGNRPIYMMLPLGSEDE